LIFIFGPCEPLIPVLMYPAAEGSWWGVALVALVFAAATLATMLAVVLLARQGLARIPLGGIERYSHALAGLALVACGLAIRLGL
jgi:threonine/homoserine/homoserine lactone efflux protein